MTEAVGFTGSKYGMTIAQGQSLRLVLCELPVRRASHGDCIGADAEFHDYVRVAHPLAEIHVRPMDSGADRAFCDGDVLHAPEAPLDRNDKIRADCRDGLLIAAPAKWPQPKTMRGQGTWSTILRRIRDGGALVIIRPDGTCIWNPSKEEVS